uniref:Uncharacterized protein n=1 Tax=Pipistrellus kuhlii TaxID=59472 RepID=A0A7J7VV31_PIPKU|nr:hypothetical protein mPipKuh1_008330 [Pipistrellus kuhlii]
MLLSPLGHKVSKSGVWLLDVSIIFAHPHPPWPGPTSLCSECFPSSVGRGGDLQRPWPACRGSGTSGSCPPCPHLQHHDLTSWEQRLLYVCFFTSWTSMWQSSSFHPGLSFTMRRSQPTTTRAWPSSGGLSGPCCWPTMDSWGTRAGLRAFQSSPGSRPAHSRAKNQALQCPDNPTACVLGSSSKGTAKTVVPNVTGQLEQHMDVGLEGQLWP